MALYRAVIANRLEAMYAARCRMTFTLIDSGERVTSSNLDYETNITYS